MNPQLPPDMTQGHIAFNPSRSPSFKHLDGATFNISYGDSSYASGLVGTDTVQIGEGAKVENQAIGLPTNISGTYTKDTAMNGMVGLGFSSISTFKPEKQKTFFENVAGSLDEPVMTARLSGDKGSEYEFGTVNSTKYQGKMVNVSVDTSNGFWQFESAKFSVGDGNGKGLQDIQKTRTAIVDTGTSIMLVSPDVATAYYAQVPGAVLSNSAGGFVFPCQSELPSLFVALGNEGVVRVPGSDLAFSRVGTNTTTGKTRKYTNDLGTLASGYRTLLLTARAVCFGGVQSNHGNHVQIYGDTFLRTLFVVFDLRGPSLGMAVSSTS